MLKSLIRFHSAIKLTITTEGGGGWKKKEIQNNLQNKSKHKKNVIKTIKA